MSEIRKKCGNPTNKYLVEVTTVGTTTYRGQGVSDYNELSRKEEVWEYDFGRHRFMKILTFYGTELREIETGGYGSK